MHADEIFTDVALVRRLIETQFPQWPDLTLEPVSSAGTENTLYRLGQKRVVRLSRRPHAAEQVQKLHRWMPVLGPALPLAVPIPVARGEPAKDIRYRGRSTPRRGRTRDEGNCRSPRRSNVTWALCTHSARAGSKRWPRSGIAQLLPRCCTGGSGRTDASLDSWPERHDRHFYGHGGLGEDPRGATVDWAGCLDSRGLEVRQPASCRR